MKSLFKRASAAATFFAVATVWLALPQLSFASRESHGGHVYACSDAKGTEHVELLDLAEAQRQGLKIDRSEGLAREAYIERALAIVQAEPKLKNFHSELVAELSWMNARLTHDDLKGALPATGDVGRTRLPVSSGHPGCQIAQIAQYQEQGRIVFDRTFFDALSALDQAALFIHEVFYKIDRVHFGATTSEVTRALTGLLFARGQADAARAALARRFSGLGKDWDILPPGKPPGSGNDWAFDGDLSRSFRIRAERSIDARIYLFDPRAGDCTLKTDVLGGGAGSIEERFDSTRGLAYLTFLVERDVRADQSVRFYLECREANPPALPAGVSSIKVGTITLLQGSDVIHTFSLWRGTGALYPNRVLAPSVLTLKL